MSKSVVMCLFAMVLLRAVYTPVKGSDPEYGQGAIERCDVGHREIERNVWLIEVGEPGDAREWERQLNTAVDAKYGSFVVRHATAEDRRRVESGEITLQK